MHSEGHTQDGTGGVASQCVHISVEVLARLCIADVQHLACPGNIACCSLVNGEPIQLRKCIEKWVWSLRRLLFYESTMNGQSVSTSKYNMSISKWSPIYLTIFPFTLEVLPCKIHTPSGQNQDAGCSHPRLMVQSHK